MKVCLVSLPGIACHVEIPGARRGGAEGQTAWLGLGLTKLGHEVVVVTTGYSGQRLSAPRLTPFRLINAYNPEDGLPGARFLFPRLAGVQRALAEADADVYFQMCAGAATGEVAWYCRRAGRGFVFATASDTDVDPRRVRLGPKERWLYSHGLHHADRVVTQHRGQARRLRENLGLDSTPIGMSAAIPDAPGVPVSPPRVLWLGNFRAVKRPEIYLRTADAFPEAEFFMIGGAVPPEPLLYESVRRGAAAHPNVVVHGPDLQPGPYLAGATLLLNTSLVEGFPTSFLEAWAHGVPTVSYFDPGDLIREHGFGLLVEDEAGLRRAVGEILASPERRAEMGRRGRRYVMAEHSDDVVSARFERELLAAARAHGRAVVTPS